MSKTLLLIICDFLLLSLLALVDFDQEDEAAAVEKEVVEQETISPKDDLIELLKMSLDIEKKNQDSTSSELAEQKAELEKTREELEKQKKNLSETHERLEKTESDLQLTETQAELLAKEKAALEKEKARLAALKRHLEKEKEKLSSNLAETQTELVQAERKSTGLAENMSSVMAEAATAKERARLLQEQLEEKEKALEETQTKITSIAEEKERAEQKAVDLQTDLEIASTEKRMTEVMLQTAQTEIEMVRIEKKDIQEHADKLAEGTVKLAEGTEKLAKKTQELASDVSTIAEASTEIKSEITKIQPLSINKIFENYQNNRVLVKFATSSNRGNRVNSVDVYSVLITDGTNLFAVMHANETPLKFTGFRSGAPDKVSAIARLGQRNLAVKAIGVLAVDPRILVIKIPKQYADEQNIEAFKIEADPFTFPEAVLISNKEGYYGDTKFMIDPQSNKHLKMQKKPFSKIRGEFAPSQSDLVFSKSGGFIGIMANNKYCGLIDSLIVHYGISIGSNYSQAKAEATLKTLRVRLSQLPGNLK